MKIQFIHKKEIGASKFGPYYTIENVLELYEKELIDKREARFMLGCITKHSFLLDQGIVQL